MDVWGDRSNGLGLLLVAYNWIYGANLDSELESRR